MSANDLAREAATIEVDNLWAGLWERHIFPPKVDVRSHTERLVKSCKQFSELLFAYETDLMWGSLPASRLAYLRQEIGDFLLEAETWSMFHDFFRKDRRELGEPRARAPE